MYKVEIVLKEEQKKDGKYHVTFRGDQTTISGTKKVQFEATSIQDALEAVNYDELDGIAILKKPE